MIEPWRKKCLAPGILDPRSRLLREALITAGISHLFLGERGFRAGSCVADDICKGVLSLAFAVKVCLSRNWCYKDVCDGSDRSG